MKHIVFRRSDNVAFLARKATVIAYSSAVNFVLASVLARVLLRRVMYRYHEKRDKMVLHAQLVYNVAIVGVFFYGFRQVSECIPLDWAKTASFDPRAVKDIKAPVLTATTLAMVLDEHLVRFYNHIVRDD
jgi:hypothetical protein